MRISASLVGALCVAACAIVACSSSDDDGSASGAAAGGASAGSSGANTGVAGHTNGGTGALGGASTMNGGSVGASTAGGASGAAGISGGASMGGTAGSANGGGAGTSSGGTGGAAPFALTSPSFMARTGCSNDAVSACDQFPTDMLLTTIGGANHSPELAWTSGPAGTLSYALVLHDDSNDYTHWAIWNIPANIEKLPASLANGSNPNGLSGVRQVSFFEQGTGYAGPGAHAHVYQFKLYALKVATISPTLPGSNPQAAVRTLLEGSADVLATTDLRGASAP